MHSDVSSPGGDKLDAGAAEPRSVLADSGSDRSTLTNLDRSVYPCSKKALPGSVRIKRDFRRSVNGGAPDDRDTVG
jgi:hypothetical protein